MLKTDSVAKCFTIDFYDPSSPWRPYTCLYINFARVLVPVSAHPDNKMSIGEGFWLGSRYLSLIYFIAYYVETNLIMLLLFFERILNLNFFKSSRIL